MAVTIINYTVIVCCATYASRKLLNRRCSASLSRKILFGILLLLEALAVYLLRQIAPSVALFLMVVISVCLCWLWDRFDPASTVTAVTIGYGISYLCYLLAVITFILGLLLRYGVDGPPNPSATYTLPNMVFVGLVQISLTVLLFRIKRLRHGLPFLSDARYGDLGVYFSVAILLAVSLPRVESAAQFAVSVVLCIFLMSGLILWFWWRRRTTQEYLKQLSHREQEELRSTIASLEQQLAVLKKENEAFSAIIHRDNKLIPVMEFAVRNLFHTTLRAETLGPPVQTDQIRELMTQLQRISTERSGILEGYEQISSALPSTQIPALDALFSYMVQQAAQSGIQLELAISGDIRDMLSGSIFQQDAYTVLADLIENAIIATASSSGEKRILVELGQRDGSDSICVSDSGIPFPAEVLKSWGTARVTTHGDSGGSGIGMMSTYEICKRYQASFSVEELGSDGPFSKRITLCFDHRDRFQYSEFSTSVMDSCPQEQDPSPDQTVCPKSIGLRDV